MILFQQILTYGYDKNFSYFIGDEESKEIAIIDPINPDMLLPMIEEQNFTVTHLIATHGHFDHIGEIPNFWEKLSLMQKLKPILLFHESLKLKLLIKGATYQLITKKQTFKIGKVQIEAILTPGHEPGSVCYLVENKLLTGDTLFINRCGRADLPGSDVHQLYNSLYSIISALPDKTLIYPGHDYGPKRFDTLMNQKKTNPYLKCKNELEFIHLRMNK